MHEKRIFTAVGVGGFYKDLIEPNFAEFALFDQKLEKSFFLLKNAKKILFFLPKIRKIKTGCVFFDKKITNILLIFNF